MKNDIECKNMICFVYMYNICRLNMFLDYPPHICAYVFVNFFYFFTPPHNNAVYQVKLHFITVTLLDLFFLFAIISLCIVKFCCSARVEESTASINIIIENVNRRLKRSDTF